MLPLLVSITMDGFKPAVQSKCVLHISKDYPPTTKSLRCLTFIDCSKSWPKKVSILSFIYLGTNSLLSYMHMALITIKSRQALIQGQNVALRDFSLLRCTQTHTNLWNWHYACMCLEKNPCISNLALPFLQKREKNSCQYKRRFLLLLSIYSSCLKPTLETRQ